MAETSQQDTSKTEPVDYQSKGADDAAAGGGGLTLSLPDEPGSRDRYLWAGVLLILTLVAYVPAIRGGFVWDDDRYVTNNRALRNLEGLQQIWFEPQKVTPQYYPLTHTTNWIEYQLWELNPLGYHLVNVVLHAGSAVLIWVILRMLRVPGAWLAAAVWALHPIQVESVAWITERKNTLCGVLFFGSILTYLRYVGFSDSDWMPRVAVPAPSPDAPADAKPAEEPWQPWQWWLLSLVLFAGAMLSKTIACSLPVCVLLILWWQGRLNQKHALATVPFFAIGLALGIVTIVMERTHVGAHGPDWDLSVAQRILIAGRAVWFYVYKLLVPINLTFSYERWNVDVANVGQWLFPLGVVAVLVVLWFNRRRIGIGPLVAALWFVVTLAPALGFINTYPMRYSFVADHFQYLSGISLIVLAVSALANAMGPLPTRAAVPSDAQPAPQSAPDSRTATAVVVSGIILAALGYLTWSQTHLYKDAITLWRDVVQKNPSSWMANQNLAAGLLELARVDRAMENVEELNKKLDEAEASLARSIELRHNNPDAWVNLGNVNMLRGKPADARACFAKAAELNPQQVGAWLGLGLTSAEAGNLAEAEQMYGQALEIHPGSASAQQGLGAVYAKQGKRDEAIAAYEKAVELNPGMSDARFQLAALLVAAGNDRAAEQQYRAILQRNPYHAESWSNLGFLVAAKGNTRANIRDARQYFQAALRINPDLPRARMGLQMADDLLNGRLPTSGPATTRATAGATSSPARPATTVVPSADGGTN